MKVKECLLTFPFGELFLNTLHGDEKSSKEIMANAYYRIVKTEIGTQSHALSTTTRYVDDAIHPLSPSNNHEKGIRL